MNIVKCTNGHFFDSDKYDECPYCAEKGEHVFEERRDMDDQMTISGNSVCDMLFENQLTERYLENVRDDEKTVSLSIVLMQITKTLHPPGGATALIAVTGSAELKNLGYWYVVSPVLVGTLILLIVALFFNNITSNRQYPINKKFTEIRKKIPFFPKYQNNK